MEKTSGYYNGGKRISLYPTEYQYDKIRGYAFATNQKMNQMILDIVMKVIDAADESDAVEAFLRKVRDMK